MRRPQKRLKDNRPEVTPGVGNSAWGGYYRPPYLNRWAQPDSIIPDPNNPLDYDRYAYTRNNPVKYTDPSGHWTCGDQYDPACAETANEYIEYMIATDEWVSNPSLNVIVEPFTIEPTHYEPPDGSSYVSQSEPEFNYMVKPPNSSYYKVAHGAVVVADVAGVVGDGLVTIQHIANDKKFAPDSYLVVTYSDTTYGLEYSLDQVIVVADINSVALANVTISGPSINEQYLLAMGPYQKIYPKWIQYSTGNACYKPYSPFYLPTKVMLVVKDPPVGGYPKITIP